MNNLLKDTADASRSAFLALAAFSALVNILMLTAPLYMLQVFDRVLASRNTDTLLLLSLIAGLAFLTLAALEGVRSLALVKLSGWLDARLGSSVLHTGIVGALARGGGASTQGLRDLGTFRSFVTGPSVFPIMDAPWTPIFIVASFVLHPVLGWIAVGGACVLLGLAIANEFATRELMQRAGAAQMANIQRADAAVRNADVIDAMGMMSNLIERWDARNATASELQAKASNRSGIITAASKFVRLALQTGTLGVGAFLVIGNELTPGGMIASTILLGRALAPVDQAIGSWKAMVAARGAYQRLREQLKHCIVGSDAMPLPRPKGELRCEAVTFGHDDGPDPTLKAISFNLPPGKVLGLVGPSAAGKTTLVRLLVGNLKPRLGHVRLDGLDVHEWPSDDRGQYVGYLPQEVELFSGTVRENIARMTNGEPDAVVQAAQLAGVHEMIMRLPKGYETEVGPGGVALSGGQRQRIALARAMYGNPSIVVLDEPNSNLDQAGTEALLGAISHLRNAGKTVVLTAHHPIIVRQADFLVVLNAGVVQMAGPMEEVIARVTGPQVAPAPAPAPGPAPVSAPAAAGPPAAVAPAVIAPQQGFGHAK